ncbi:MAG TPA: C4-type zinc ribbon domain-containing protein [Pyrinomonadaceae bacterium]|nr:C4-type zinc ribbon domain-containing protein [Pyrinomonadaceae bacterium]
MKVELQKLIALQNLDTTIRKLEKDQEAIPERRAEIEREFDQRAFEIRALENRRDEAKHTRARLENEVVEQKGRAERAERNLMSSKKQDEYTAAIREADSARKQISQLETQILEQLEVLEQAEAALNERADEIASLNSDRDARLKAFDDETGTIGDRLAVARKERDEVFANLPKQMSGMYARIKARIRDGVAVAEARNRSCSACFMSLRPQVMAEIRRGEEVLTCDNCGRILYFVPSESIEADASAPQPNVAIS